MAGCSERGFSPGKRERASEENFVSTTQSDPEAAPRSGGRRIAGLIRHADFDRPEETASAHQLLPLSPLGREQARAGALPILELCETLGLELDPRIESSQLLRAWQTAQIIAEELGARTGIDFEIVERVELAERGIGSCTNLRFERIRELLEQDPRLDPLPDGWRRMPDFRLPVLGAESLMDAGRRAAHCIETSLGEIPKDEPRDVLRLFVAHGGCLRHAAVCLGTLELGEVSNRTMDFAQCILVERLEGEWRQIAGEWKKKLPIAEPTD
jgi:2,3-bisphosphoglycerate-dependent phosphoglycerate mutase